jgi:hypothetical protein
MDHDRHALSESQLDYTKIAEQQNGVLAGVLSDDVFMEEQGRRY